MQSAVVASGQQLGQELLRGMDKCGLSVSEGDLGNIGIAQVSRETQGGILSRSAVGVYVHCLKLVVIITQLCVIIGTC